MSLRAKISVILLTVFIFYAGLDYTVLQVVVFPSFVALEREEAQKNLVRCMEALRREIFHLDTFNHDWAAWDDTYAFVRDGNGEYIQSNLVAQTFVDNNLNLIFVCNEKGRVVWGEIRDADTWQKIRIPELPDGHMPPTHPLLQHRAPDSVIAGVFMTEQTPFIISSRPIVTTNSEGPIRGSLVMGRFLNAQVVNTIVSQTQVGFRMWPVPNGNLPEPEKNALSQITGNAPYVIKDMDANTLYAYSAFHDITGAAALLLRAELPKRITAHGKAALRFALFSVLAAGCVALAALWIMLRQTVVKPISKLTSRVVSIGSADTDTSQGALVPSADGDEIKMLMEQFDHMINQLSEAQRKLTEQSYYSGMAEMAAGILHNVRNALSPMVVDINLVRESVDEIPLRHLQKALEELGQNNLSPERKEGLLRFLSLGHKTLVESAGRVKDQLEDMAKRVHHIEEILPDRHDMRAVTKPTEQIDGRVICKEAVALMPSTLLENVNINIDASLNGIKLSVQRILFVHVVANILVNAAESIHKKGQGRGLVRVEATTEEIDGVNMAHFSISDDGEGIEASHLQRIFERGFTTKSSSAWGIGLHWVANTVASMNGNIYAESKGVGKGACFHLLLPASAAQNPSIEPFSGNKA